MRLYTLTQIARLLGRDYRGLKKRNKAHPIATVDVGGYNVKLFNLEQFLNLTK